MTNLKFAAVAILVALAVVTFGAEQGSCVSTVDVGNGPCIVLPGDWPDSYDCL